MSKRNSKRAANLSHNSGNGQAPARRSWPAQDDVIQAGRYKGLTINQAAREYVNNELLDRVQWMKSQLDADDKDIDKSCGYQTNPTPQLYRTMIDREGVASRVNKIWPDECWQSEPEIYEKEAAEETPWDAALKLLVTKHQLYSWWARLDEAAGIGAWAIGVLGINDGKELWEPAELPGWDEAKQVIRAGTDAVRELRYLRIFDESLVTISKVDEEDKSPRFGQPSEYTVKVADPTKTSKTYTNKRVHWTRVIHVPSDGRIVNEWAGEPRLQTKYNYLHNIRKILGGSAEMFWKGGFPGISWEVDPHIAAEAEFTPAKKQAFIREVRAYGQGLRRDVIAVGIRANQLAPNIADPGPHLDVQLRAISIALAVPWRVFMGSEAAQLASEQDTIRHNGRVMRRQDRYDSASIIRPTLDRFMMLGVLPGVPEYVSKWPDLNSPTKDQRVATALKVVEMMEKYITGKVYLLIPEREFFTMILEWEPDKVEEVLKAAVAKAALSEKLKEEEAPVPGEDDTEGSGGFPPKKAPVGNEETEGGEGNRPLPFVRNAFCATGPGGGVDPTCGKGGKGSGGGLAPLSKNARALVKSHEDAAEARGKASLEKLGKSPEETARIKADLEKAWDRAEITINFDAQKASAASRFPKDGDGEFKTAFETAKGNPGYLRGRRGAEETVLGISQDAPNSDRPMYAAVNWTNNLFGAASVYGGASVVLNREAIADRSTITPRDSFGVRTQDTTGTMANPMAAIAHNHQALTAAGHGNHGARHVDNAYNEVAIHGGSFPINARTVREIRLPASDAGSPHAPAIKEFAERHGIPLRVFHDTTGKNMTFDAARTGALQTAAREARGRGIMGFIRRMTGTLEPTGNYNPCRDSRGRYASCGSGAAADRMMKAPDVDTPGGELGAKMKADTASRKKQFELVTLGRRIDDVDARREKLQPKFQALRDREKKIFNDPAYKTSKGRKAGDEKLKKIVEQENDLWRRVKVNREERERLVDRARERIALSPNDRGQSEITGVGNEGPLFQGAQFTRSILGKGLKMEADVGIDFEVGRSYHTGGVNNGRSNVLMDKVDAGTMVHELAHAIEHQNPHVRAASHDFLAQRCGGEKPKPMSELGTGFQPHETGRDDNFGRAFGDPIEARYVGTPPRAVTGNTEVVSMGVEALYRDPTRLARNDPEYFRFIVGVTSGRIR